MNDPRQPRRIKLVRPRLQLRLIGWFLGISTIGLLLQYLLLGWFLNDLAVALPTGGPEVAAAASGKLLKALALSFLFLLPMTLAVGVLVTFRIAGPVHRLETHLAEIARGERPGPCRLRAGDELQQLCSRVNLAVDALSAQPERRSAAPRRAERVG